MTMYNTLFIYNIIFFFLLFKNRFKVGIVTYGKRADVKLTFRQSIKKRNVLSAVSSIR